MIHNSSRIQVLHLVLAALLFAANPTAAQDDLSHRKAPLTVNVVDIRGHAVPDALLDISLTRHAFRFGTQVRDKFLTIREEEFAALGDSGRQALLPDLASFGQPNRYTPAWNDVLLYRQTVLENFNHIVPTTGLQWTALLGNGPEIPDRAFQFAAANGLDATGASVVWQRDRWPTPVSLRSANAPAATDLQSALLADRLGPTGVMARFSATGEGPNVTDWKVLNEPLHEDYYSSVFVDAGLYPDATAVGVDYFNRARALRPNATLSINDYNLLNSGNDTNTVAFRDLILALLDAGAPIDRIGVQAHMARVLSRADIDRRLDILAETGLGIEITEFDMRDDAGQLTAIQQEALFTDILEASFAHPAVDGFILWGFWDPGHWRGNGPLLDETWQIKTEAAPYFDLVRGAWWPELEEVPVDAQGIWTAPGNGLIQGTYTITAHARGRSVIVHDLLVQDETTTTLILPIDISVLETCGNGILESGEECDAGSWVAAQASCCNRDCTLKPDGPASCDGVTCTTNDLCLAGVCTSGACAQGLACLCGGQCLETSAGCICQL